MGNPLLFIPFPPPHFPARAPTTVLLVLPSNPLPILSRYFTRLFLLVFLLHPPPTPFRSTILFLHFSCVSRSFFLPRPVRVSFGHSLAREDRVVDIERWKGIGGSQGNSKTKLNEMSASMRDTQILISRESHESFQLNSMLTPDERLIFISFHWEMHRFCRSVYSSSPRDRNRKSISGLIILIHRLFKRVPNVR